MKFSRTVQHYGGQLDLMLQKARYSVRKRFSRSDEQQILKQYIDELVPKDRPRTVVDIGQEMECAGQNSYALVLEGWNALGIEADPQKYELLTQVFYRRFPNAKACNRRVQPDTLTHYWKVLISIKTLAFFVWTLTETIIGFSMQFCLPFVRA